MPTLRRACFVAALTIASVAPTQGADARSGFGQHDAAQLLYSTQLAFTPEGMPIVSVGIMDRQEQVLLSARGGLRVSLSGNGGSSVTIPPGHEVRLTVRGGSPGQTRYRVVMEGQRGGDIAAIKDARDRWQKAGIEVESIELGGIVGYPGRLLDNRVVLLAERAVHSKRASAEARARALEERFELPNPPSVFAQPDKRASGTVTAVDTRSGVVVSQRDLLSFTAADGGTIKVARVEYGRGYGHHGFQDRLFHGSIVVAVDPAAQLAVVNRVSAEHMLRGLVPSEIFPTAPAASLDAQAISARGELLAKLGVRHLADPFLVCAAQHCQVYSGKAKEKKTTNAAVERTRGLMLFSEAGKLVDTVYSASCGGHTEHNEHVWDGTAKSTLRGHDDGPVRKGASSGKSTWKAAEIPTEDELRRFLEAPPDTHCGNTSLGNKVFRWVRRYPDKELDALVNARHAIGHVTGIEVIERGVSGRVVSVRFKGTRGDVVVGRELAVRRLLGNLRSGMFVVDRSKGEWALLGGGYGHGVGMCQYGAIGMADRGKKAHEILQHYYSGTSIEKVY